MSPDYFQLLELPPAFDIDMQALEAAYFKQQRLFHPDRFIGREPDERQRALLRSGDINQAYRTLKNPLTRAQYLLHLQGIAVGTEADSIKPAQSLLMDTLEWRESIEAARDAATLDKVEHTLGTMMADSLNALSQQYKAGRFDSMAQEALRLGYLQKAAEAAELKQKRLLKSAAS